MEANTILIVEDDAGLSELLSEKAEDSGYYTLNVYNAMTALEWLKEHTPFLMILDYSLPDMNGKELITELMGKGIKIPPFIVSTGQGDERIAVEMMKLGARDYIIKDNNFLDMMPLVISKVSAAIENENKLKLAEKALKHSHDLMRYIIEHNRSAIAIHDRDLKYIYVSQRYLQEFNIKEKDIIGKHHYEVFPDLPQRWKEVHQRSLAGEVLSAEDDLYFRDDGTMEWTRWECRPWYEPEGEIGGIVIYTEITSERKRTLEALKESEEKYRFIFANNPQPMWIYDLETMAFLEVNDAAIEHYGYSKEEFLKMTLKDIRPAEDILLLVENIKKISTTQNSTEVWRHKKKNGEIIYVEITAHSVLFNGRKARHVLIIDITNRKLAEKQLKLLSKAIEQSPITVVITDKEGNIEYANPKFTATTGYTLEEVKGKNPRVLKSGHHPRAYYEELWNTILAGEEWTGEFHNKKKNGESFWEKAVISSIVNNTGEIDYFFAVKEDITEMKKLIEELILSKEKAEESDRLKSAFLANMSHEIRTPLNGIIGFSELLNDPDFDQEQKTEFTKAIIENGNQLLVIISDIMDISMLEARQIKIRKEQFAIHQLFVDLKNEFSAKVSEKRLQFQINGPSDFAGRIIENDYYRMRQVFTNLIGNALKFTNSGYIEIGFVPKEEGVEFYVKDTGIGISPEFHEDIFERFRQVDETKARKYGGNGLGLAISKNLVEMLGGRIWVESEEEIGSTFYFILTDNGKGELIK